MELSVVQAAEHVGVTTEAVRAQLRDGRIRGRLVRRGRRHVWLVSAEDVAAWAARRAAWERSRVVPVPLPWPLSVAAPVAEPAPSSSPERVAQLEQEVAALHRQVDALLEALRTVTAIGLASVR